MSYRNRNQILFSNPSTLPVDVKVNFSGIEECEPGHKGVGIRDHYLLHYVLSGKGVVISRKKKYELNAGDSFLYYPAERHYYRADSSDPWHYVWVGFSGEKIKEILDNIHLLGKGPVIFGEFSSKIENYFSQMRECLSSLAATQDYMSQGLLYMILTEIEANKRTKEKFHNDVISTLDFYINQSIDFIRRNYQHNINVNRIVQYIGYNRSYFTMSFKNATGVSLYRYLVSFRMNKAIELLKSTKYSVSEVAYSVGFKDYFTFARAFKKFTGSNPLDIRSGKNHGIV